MSMRIATVLMNRNIYFRIATVAIFVAIVFKVARARGNSY
jgi:hypothetical protein